MKLEILNYLDNFITLEIEKLKDLQFPQTQNDSERSVNNYTLSQTPAASQIQKSK